MGSLLLVLIYICFISLGLPDSLLGSAWPVLHTEICVPVSYAGIISATITVGTILSSLFSDKLLRKFGAGLVTAVSITVTAICLFGFSISTQFWMLILWAIPFGLGAGGVDAILNNYVALHYKAQHMSWLHCMWGVGAAVSPYIMSFSLVKLESWSGGYLIVSIIQAVLCVIIFISIPLWKKGSAENNVTETQAESKSLSFKEIFSIKGAVPCFLTFFCYCAMEVTTSLWASTYLVEGWGFSPETAAGYASMFYIGITLGRLVNGFLAMKLSDKFLIRMGSAIIAVGIALMLVPFHFAFALTGFVVIGLGCAPVYPCIIHMTPSVFGRDKSQAMIGVQMAFAYTGFLIVPPLFGIIAENISISLLPPFLAILLVLMLVMHELVLKKAKNNT
ncbi:MAG: MFS transporter [Clostridia bacterium]|nr:MFS transporter [Clostridia bacterium]MBQ7907801.1 MFS transporter [Clostridia bacterium]